MKRDERPSAAFALLLAALWCSGVAGLTYQVVWLRLLAISFGVTAYAAATVLAGFMAGLALGSIVAGRIAGRAARPLRLFAAAEVVIAGTALASQAVLLRLPGWYGALVAAVGEDAATLTVVRFAGAFVVLAVPTSLMGATLPLVSASRLVLRDDVTARVSAVYAANTGGAIAGALVTGWYLIGSLGLSASVAVAGLANLAAAAIAWALARAEERQPVVQESAPPARIDAAGTSTGLAGDGAAVRRAVLVVLALSGIASLALEVIWFRILVLFVPATTYAFTAMLATVLFGIFVGSWVAARLLRREADWVGRLAVVHAATGAVVLLSLWALAWTYQRGWRTSSVLPASLLTIAPAAILMGVAFPIALRLWARSTGRGEAGARHLPRDLGAAYAVNVCGAIAGALLGGFVLLPSLGSRASLIACAAVYAVCAMVLAAVAPARRRAMAVAAGAIAVLVLGARVVPDPYDAALERRHGRHNRVLFHEEGVQTTVAVHGRSDGRLVLFLDGLHQASDSHEMLQVHRRIGHLPMALHPDPRRALVIGLGGGATAGAVSRHRTAVDVVELSDGVRRGAEWFSYANHDVLRRPNVRLHVADGRNFLLTTRQRYDVVTADIIQPVHAGAGLLYAVEYYRLARNVLDDDGLMLQWIGHRPEREWRLMARSFLEVFPEATLWADGSLLVGSTRPLAVSRSAFERQRQHPETRAALDAIGLDTFETLQSWYVAGPRTLRAFVGPGPVLTDDRPWLEYNASMPGQPGVVDLSPLTRNREPLPVVP